VSTYREPQIPDIETLAETINRYMFDYRRVYIEQPRVRMDGAYIAICHYV
jgi:F-box protein 9